MAVVNVKSTAISNADATPRIANSPYIDSGMARASVGKAAVAATDNVNSTYRTCRIPSNARINSIGLTNDAGGATGTVNIGLYRTAADGGAAVSASLFAAAKAVTAAQRDVEVGAALAADKEKRLWEYLGLTSDPGIDYDIVATLAQVVASGINLALEVWWTE